MEIKNISVDDILGEIKSSSVKKNIELTDLDRVNMLIEEILTQKQAEQQKEELSLKEKKEVREMIKAQSKTLTMEFASIAADNPAILDNKKDEPITAQKKETKTEDTNTLSISFEELSKKISNDFDKMQEEISKSETPAKADEKDASQKAVMTEDDYVEFRQNRNKKIADFTLGEPQPQTDPQTAKPPVVDAQAVLDNTVPDAVPESEQDIKINEPTVNIEQESDALYDIEYRSPADKEKLIALFNGTKKSVSSSMIMMIVMTVLSVSTCFFTLNSNKMTLFNVFSVSTRMYALMNMVFTLFIMLFGSSVISNAFRSLREGRPDKDIALSAAAFISLVFDIMLVLNPDKLYINGVYMYTALLSVMYLVNFTAKKLSIKRIIKNFEFVSSEEDKFAISKVRESSKCYEYMASYLGKYDKDAVLLKNVQTDFLSDFLSTSSNPDAGDKVSNKMLLFGIAAGAVACAAAILLRFDIYVGISAFVLMVLLSSGLLSFMMSDLPLYDSSSVVNYFSGTTPEYSAVEEYSQANSIMMDAGDLFKDENIVLHGIKTFEGKRIDDAILDAASVVCAANSVLKYMFLDIIANKTDILRKVDTIIYEDLMGISAWVDDRRVLIGNRDLMINHSVAVPKAEFESKYQQDGNRIVYLANGGELSAAFVIELKGTGDADDMVSMLTKNDITIALKTVDSFLTADLLGAAFDVSEEYFAILPSRLHNEFVAEHKKITSETAELGNNGSIFGFSVLVSACKKLSACVKLGTVLMTVQAILGIIFVLAAIFLKNTALIATIPMLLLNSVFALVYWVYEKNMKL